MTREELLTCLNAGDFEALVGAEESETLDFKRTPYDLNESWQVFELAKDVSALANVRGGLLVVGFETEQVPDSMAERVSRPRPFTAAMAQERRHHDFIRDRVYPVPAGLRVEFKPSAANPTRGVLVIDVPSQDEAAKPFLIAKPFDDRAATRGWLLGIARRSFDATETYQLGELHAQLTQGRNLGPRFDAIDAALARIHAPPEAGGEILPELAPALQVPVGQAVERDEALPVAPPRRNAEHLPGSELLEARVEERLRELPEVVQELPLLYLGAAPRQYTEIPTIFRSEGVRQLLEEPPMTRHNGWNLGTLDRARIVRGSLLTVSNGTRKYISLYEDGTLVAIGNFINFLGDRAAVGPPKVNALAVIEFIHDFVLTYDALIPHLRNAGTYRYVIGVRRAHYGEGHALFLPPYSIDSMGFRFGDTDDYPPIDDPNWSYSFTDSRSHPLPVGEIALKLVERLYAAFGRMLEEVPYTNEERTQIEPTTFPS